MVRSVSLGVSFQLPAPGFPLGTSENAIWVLRVPGWELEAGSWKFTSYSLSRPRCAS